MTLSIETLSYHDVAKTIDHSLLKPELDDAFVRAGCGWRPRMTSRRCAAARPTWCAPGTILAGHGCQGRHDHRLPPRQPPHRHQGLRGAAGAGGRGRPSWTWCCSSAPSSPAATRRSRPTSRAVVEVAHAAGAIVKVIFENAYLTDDEKIRACRLTEAAGGDFVKTSTGFAPVGRDHDDLRLMRANTSPACPGQGCRRCPDARRADRGDAARGHPVRRDRDRDDHP